MIAVVGCGNPNRQDDGVGPAIIRMLRERRLASLDVRLFDAGTDGMSVMFAARGCSCLIVVDAASSGSAPGAIFEVPGGELARPYRPGLNMHDFRWDAAIYTGQQILRDQFPGDVTVLLIEAQDLGLGIGLSDVVSAAAMVVAEKIVTMIGERTAGSMA